MRRSVPDGVEPSVPEHVPVSAPASDSRRERIERGLFAQLHALRNVDSVNMVAPSPQPRRLPPLAAGGVAGLGEGGVRGVAGARRVVAGETWSSGTLVTTARTEVAPASRPRRW